MNKKLLEVTPGNDNPIFFGQSFSVREGWAKYGTDDPFLCFTYNGELIDSLTIDEARQLKARIEEWLWDTTWNKIKKLHIDR